MSKSPGAPIAASIIVFAAPALMFYAHSGLGMWNSALKHWVLSAPVAVNAGALAYVVILGTTGSERRWPRVAAAALICLCGPILTLFVVTPFLIGFAENNPGPTAWGIVAAVLSVPTAAAQVTVLSRHRRRILEFVAYPIAAFLAVVIVPAGSRHWSIAAIPDASLFAQWPKTFAATPFAALAASAAVQVSFRRLAWPRWSR